MNALSRRFAVVLGCLAAVAACGDGTTGGTTPTAPATPVPTTIVLTTTQQTLFVGESATLTASVNDQFGHTMQSTLSWTSDDPTIATATSGGVVTAADAGIVDVVVSGSGLTAAVQVAVRFNVAEDEIRLRVRGSMDETWQWSESFVWDVDFLGSPDEVCHLFLTEQPFSFFGRQQGWYVGLQFPQALGVGVTTFGNWDLATELDRNAFDRDKPIAFVAMDETSGRSIVFADRGTSWMEIDRVDAPPGPGMIPGRVEGRLVFEGEGYEVFWDGNGGIASATATGETITVHGDFSTPYLSWTAATTTSEFVDGPFAGPFEQWDFDVEYVGDWGDQVGYRLDYTGDRGDYSTWLDVHIPDMSVGTYAIGSPGWLGWTAPYPWVSGTVDFEPTSATLLELESHSGTLTIESFLPGQGDEIFGEVKGQLTALLEGFDEYGWATGDHMTWNLTFHAPVYSTEPGAVAQAPRSRDRTPGLLGRLSPLIKPWPSIPR